MAATCPLVLSSVSSRRRALGPALLILCGSALLVGCGDTIAPPSDNQRQDMAMDNAAALTSLKDKCPQIDSYFHTACAYALFPDVVSGALVLGGAHGEGSVYQGDTLIGYADVSQGTIGLQAGGQSFAELIFFQNPAALQHFKEGKLTPDARASAVAEAGSVGTAASYEKGVAVFTVAHTGLMAQASVGAQKFRFVAVTPRADTDIHLPAMTEPSTLPATVPTNTRP